ncbi:NnrS family protein [Ramlibacter tataouinensis]|uniref:NnrS family protein n=1 Tax=Ramlibacter tataouinensis TaxID=94132 RepID=UPI0022F3A1E7|nr:NnrS family protein [Ramlibacter tataouinensis]WBY02519.1 NnrS family protein [Ramlibacter tataouinensis]
MTGPPADPLPSAWRPGHLLLAPHRLGFFLGGALLVAASLWWGWVLLARAAGMTGPAPALPAVTLHSALMVFGFLPLFFVGFLFTAAPRWLYVRPLPARALVAPALLQAGGWLLWLLGGHGHLAAAVTGLLAGTAGLGWNAAKFWALVRASSEADRLHPKLVGWALGVGIACQLGLALALLLGAPGLQRALVQCGLWAFVVVVFVTVAHRMLPFFTSDAVPLVRAWGPFWMLWLMVGAAGFEAIAVWVDAFGASHPAWLLLRGGLEVAAGAALVAVAVAWSRIQSLKVRLMRMLHLGFAWLGLALLLAGGAHLAQGWSGQPVLPLAPLHALAMGCLGSLLLAMVTRVAAGHSGRPQAADDVTWLLFWALQAATVLRIAASLPLPTAPVLLAVAALVWAGVVLAWAFRLGDWYGRTRPDGRPG